MNIASWSSITPAYTTVDRLLDDVFMHMATCDFSTYLPEKSEAPRTTIDANFAKPSPTKNVRAKLGRRKTILDDGIHRRKLAISEQDSAKPGLSAKTGHSHKTHRPVSWHSTPHVKQHLQDSPTFTGSSCDGSIPFSYPNDISTTSPFNQTPSDIYDARSSMPTTKYQSPTYLYQDPAPFFPYTPVYPQNQPFEVIPQPGSCDSCLPLAADAPYPYQLNWGDLSLQTMDNVMTTPPTPHDLNPHQQIFSFPQEDMLPPYHHPLSDEDSGGEELIGMGLYDNPEPCKPVSSELSFDDYRSCFMTHHTGNSRGQFLYSPGKGLKLEETWNPPSDSDNEDEDTRDQGHDDVSSEVGQVDGGVFAVAVSDAQSPMMSQNGRSYFASQNWT